MKGNFEVEQNIKNTDASMNLNPDKSELIIQQGKITKTIKHFFGQTFISQCITLNPSKTQLMNSTVYQDIMSYIANFVNQQDLNLVISMQSTNHHNENRLPNYILRHSIVIEHNQKQQQEILESIGEILIIIGEKTEQICINTYLNGDNNLDNEIQVVLNEYQQIAKNIE